MGSSGEWVGELMGVLAEGGGEARIWPVGHIQLCADGEASQST